MFSSASAWPFRGDITVQLLNQQEQIGHYTGIVYFNDKTPIEYARRVTDGKINNGGFGFPQFISHSELGYRKLSNSQYLANDCLYFRVKAKLL